VKSFAPVLAIALAVMWLLLNDTVSPGHVVLGIGLAIALTLWSAKLRPLRPHLYRPLLAIGLLWTVFVDIVRSNIAVARIILGLVGERRIRSAFLDIPLELRDPHGLAVLATIVTSTPGTVWVDFNAERGQLTLHVLDLRDEEVWIRIIKDHYERPLLGIFQP